MKFLILQKKQQIISQLKLDIMNSLPKTGFILDIKILQYEDENSQLPTLFSETFLQ